MAPRLATQQARPRPQTPPLPGTPTPIALEELARHCQAAGDQALAVPTDMTDEAAVAELAHRAVERFGRIDIWVNNAGVYLLGSLEATPPAAFRQVLETNFFGYVHGARAVLPRFREQGHGVLINNASVYSHIGAPWLTAYVSSKFAVRGFSEALRQELGDLPDVHVCTVSPSPIDTPIFARTANYSGRAVKAPPSTYPPEQVASAILASALRPKRERIVGGAGRLATLMETVAPRQFERTNRRYVDRLQFAAEPAPVTDGNLYAPVGGGRAAGRRLDHHRPDRHSLQPNLTGSNRDCQYGRGCREASRDSYYPWIVARAVTASAEGGMTLLRTALRHEEST
jgi:NAD(P)-dependent dehydrogenase (short-subunit alcohol dehydrogenase family)